jgi:hypothetical protein
MRAPKNESEEFDVFAIPELPARRCANETCNAKLSRTNPGPFCWPCERARSERRLVGQSRNLCGCGCGLAIGTSHGERRFRDGHEGRNCQ